MRKPVREVRELLKKAGVTEAQLAARMAKSRSQVPRLLAASPNLSDGLVSATRAGTDATKSA
jgi:hypothetical protein